MNTTMKLGGAAAAACAACCAVSVVPAVMAGTSLVAIGGATTVWGLGIAALAVPVDRALFSITPQGRARCELSIADGFRRRLRVRFGLRRSCHGTSRSPAPSGHPISRSAPRASAILRAARFGMRRARRSASLSIYAPDAIEEVRDLVRKEQSCCAFLAFDLKENAAGVLLTITAPGSAADAADALFDHFAPELAAPKLMAVAVTTRI